MTRRPVRIALVAAFPLLWAASVQAQDKAAARPVAAQPAVAWSWEHWDERNLPVEPASSAPAGDDAKRLQDLRNQ